MRSGRAAPNGPCRFTPSSSGVSLGLLLGPYIPLAMLVGCAVLTAATSRFKSQAAAQAVLVPIAAGMIAGEGLAGIVQAFLGLLKVPQGLISSVGCYGFPC